MARQRSGRISVYKPRRHRKKWRIEVRDSFTRKRSYLNYDSEKEARKGYKKLVEEATRHQAPTVLEVLPSYRRYMLDKGNKESSVKTSMFRLEKFFEANTSPISLLTRKDIESMYAARCGITRADTSRNELNQVKTFFRWLVKTERLSENPSSDIEPVLSGRRRKGKAQLRPAEAKRFLDQAILEAREGNDGSLACAMALLLGLRQSEITGRVVRDVDLFTKVLYVEDAKTEAGNRAVEIPKVLYEILKSRAGERQPLELLFQNERGNVHHPAWVRENTRRICRNLGLPRITAHGLRGTHASLARGAGVTGHMVSQQLGHASYQVTQDHYLADGIDAEQERKAALRVLEGGKPS